MLALLPSPVDLEGLAKLFNFDKKADLERYAKDAVIHSADFSRLLWAARTGQIPYHYARHFAQNEPAHLHPTEADLTALKTNGLGRFKPAAQKAANKVFQMFEDRRLLAGHLFYTIHENKPLYWHMISFDQRDEEQRPGRNHWVGGPHVHFVNWLWPNYDPVAIWDGFVREGRRPKGLHIRHDWGVTEQELAADRSARAAAGRSR